MRSKEALAGHIRRCWLANISVVLRPVSWTARDIAPVEGAAGCVSCSPLGSSAAALSFCVLM